MIGFFKKLSDCIITKNKKFMKGVKSVSRLTLFCILCGFLITRSEGLLTMLWEGSLKIKVAYEL